MPFANIPKTELTAPAELVSFVQRLVRNARAYAGVERRSARRELLVVPVQVVPVDHAFTPIGDEFTVVTRDISPHGIGLVHFERLKHRLLAMQTHLCGEEANLVGEIVWQKPLGPFELIGCRFVARLREFPHQDEPC